MKKLFISVIALVIAMTGQTHLAARDAGSQTPGVQPRPTMVARQLEKEEEKLRSAFDRDVNSGKSQPEDWEDRRTPFIERAADIVTAFKVADWQDDELRALARLFYFAHQYERALEADRKLLAAPELDERDEQKGYRLESRFRLVNALIELERIDEAGAAFVELERVDTAMPEVLAGRVFLHRTLTDIYLENLQLDKAVRQAIAGFDVARRITQRPVLPDAARQARDIEGAKLIAIAIAGLERLEQKGLAEELQRRWRQNSRGRPAQSETVFESELATQRLIGRPVPELAAKFWIDSSPLTPANLRGKVVLLHFWAMWNAASTNQLERLNRWQTKFGERGFQVIGVTRLFGRSDRQDGLTSKEELASLEAFKKARNVRFPLAVAGLDDVTNDERFNSTALPMLLLVDRQGLVRRIDRERTQYRKFEKQLDKLTAARDAVGNK